MEDASNDVVNIDSVDDGLLSDGGVTETTDIPVNDTSDLTIDLTDGFVDLSNGVLSETASNQPTSEQINETNITDNLDNNDADDDECRKSFSGARRLSECFVAHTWVVS